jgi:hypothetical protein
MVLGVQVDKVIQEIGHKHGTKAKELAGVLRNHGVQCAGKRKVWRGETLPNKALLSVSTPIMRRKHRFHWALKAGNLVHDP